MEGGPGQAGVEAGFLNKGGKSLVTTAMTTSALKTAAMAEAATGVDTKEVDTLGTAHSITPAQVSRWLWGQLVTPEPF